VPGQEKMIPSDLKLLIEYQKKAAKLQRAFSGASQLTGELKNRLSAIKRALNETSFPVDNLVIRSLSIEKRLNDIITNFSGDQTKRSRNENSSWSIGDRVSKAVDDLSSSTSRPTKTVQDAFNIASEEFSAELKKLKEIVEIDLPQLEKAMEEAGAPWTPGRIPVWEEK
jgi:sulfite reductase alpha subunit-like flavoprotein